MRKTHLFLIFCLIGIAVGCSETKRLKKSKTHAKATLIHPLFFQEEVSSLINFPFWFNDSIIRKNRIESVLWTTYGSFSKEAAETETDEFPKRTVRYTFNKLGQLIHIQNTDFFEGIIISHQSFQIFPKGKNNYAGVKQLDNTYGVANSSYLIVPHKMKKNVAQYDNNVRNERTHFIANNRFWGALSVDSIAHAKPSDWVILGAPHRPEKRYHVYNTVTERKVTHYTYHNANFPNETTNEDYPFTRKRSFNYSKNGVFVGYVDSTFIDGIFVTRNIARIYQDKNQLPTKIIYKKGLEEGNSNYQKRETLQYIYQK